MGIEVIAPTFLLQQTQLALDKLAIANSRWDLALVDSGMLFHLKSGADHLASFQLNLMPACPNICISHGAYVNSEFRGRGLGSLLHDLRLQIARYWGCQYVMATDDFANTAQSRILKNARWRKLLTFKNYLTDHDVNLRIKVL